jgi:hypothetical protein
MCRMLMLVLWYDTVNGHGLWNIENPKKPSLDKIGKSGYFILECIFFLMQISVLFCSIEFIQDFIFTCFLTIIQ